MARSLMHPTRALSSVKPNKAAGSRRFTGQALALESAQRGRGIDTATGPAVGTRFAVELPERGRLELVIDNLTEVVEGVTTMTGSLADEGEGDFVLGSVKRTV